MSATGTLVIVGAGRVGRTLGRLFYRTGSFASVQAIGRDEAAVRACAAFIGPNAASRTDLQGMDVLPEGTIVMIATPDKSIGEVSEQLAKRHLIGAGHVVFHCSGLLDRTSLAACAQRGAAIASVHPLASFANPEVLSRAFAGVYCACEGDQGALAVLDPLFRAIGAQVVRLSAHGKAAYHAGAVLGSGYLVAVIEAALSAELAAGINRQAALAMLGPLITMSVQNALRSAPMAAITGPLTRGDDAVVRAHHEALLAADPLLARCYAALTSYSAALLARPDPLPQIDGGGRGDAT